MTFRPPVSDKALIACGRHCCICHKFCGLKIELHHIRQEQDGGDDSFENCIAVCFDCHADMRGYDTKHPRGRKYTEAELRGHRDAWYKKVAYSTGLISASEQLPLDRQTFSALRAELPWSAIEFFDQRPVAGTMPLEALGPLEDFVVSGRDPGRELLDADLEGLRAKLMEAISSLLDVVGTVTFPSAMTGVNQVPPEWKQLNHEGYAAAVKSLAEHSHAVVQAYKEFVGLGRRKLGVD